MSELTLKQRIEELRGRGFLSKGDRDKFMDSLIAIIDAMYDEFFDAASDIPNESITIDQLYGLDNHDSLIIAESAEVDLMSTGDTTVYPATTGKSFVVASSLYGMEITAYNLDGGSAGTDPQALITDVCSLSTFSQSGMTVGKIYPMFTGSPGNVDIDSSPLTLTVQTAGTITSGGGSEEIKGKLHVIGLLV